VDCDGGSQKHKVDLGVTGSSVKLSLTAGIALCHCTKYIQNSRGQEEKECNSSATAAKTDLYKILGLHRQKVMMICVENAKDREIGERTHSEATQNQKSL
jgi:hypothetical protein